MMENRHIPELSHNELVKIRRMRPGMLLDIQAKSPTSVHRARTDLIGIDYQRGLLLLRLPEEAKRGNLRDAIHPGAFIVLRFILEQDAGEVVAFKCKTEAVISPPVNYVLANFPEQVESQRLRKEQRNRVNTPVDILNEQEHKVICSGSIVDISHTGCRVAIDELELANKAETGQRIVMALERPDGKDIHLGGAIKNIKKDLNKCFFGIKFETPREIIDELMMQMLIGD